MTRPTARFTVLGSTALVASALFCALFPVSAQPADGPDPGKAALGKNSFRQYCGSCHGREAVGNGSVAEILKVKPADLTMLSKNNGGEFPYDRVSKIVDGRTKVKGHGGGEMPVWGETFRVIGDSDAEADERIEKLAHYLWSIQKD